MKSQVWLPELGGCVCENEEQALQVVRFLLLDGKRKGPTVSFLWFRLSRVTLEGTEVMVLNREKSTVF